MASASLPTMEIAVNKTQLFKLILGSLVFLALGVWLVIWHPAGDHLLYGHPIVMAVVGVLGIILALVGLVVAVPRILSDKPGLIIGETGFIDNIGALTVGEVAWQDIESLSLFEAYGTKLIIVVVKNPVVYMERQPSTAKRKMMELNLKNYQSPLSIAVDSLKIPHQQLLDIITERVKASQR